MLHLCYESIKRPEILEILGVSPLGSCSQVLAGEKDWTRSTEFRCKELTYTVTGLTEGSDYYIRVIAVNDAGPGAPGVTEPVTVKEPQGMKTLSTTEKRDCFSYVHW